MNTSIPQMARQLEAKDDAIVALFEIVQSLTKADSQPRLKAFKIAFGSVGTPSDLLDGQPESVTGVSSKESVAPLLDNGEEKETDLGEREA
jgi:hypothetical protein